MTSSATIFGSGPALVAASDLFLYPISVGTRLDGHGWFKFHHSWWRTSEFHRLADRDVRAVWLDLVCAAQDEDPVGTLPVEEDALAYLVRMPLEEWRSFTRRAVSPLYGWEKCLCSDGRVRLYHPKLLLVTQDAARSKTDAEARRASDRERKRLADLPSKIVQAGGSQRMADDMGYVLRLDEWLLKNLPAGKIRTVHMVRDAMERLDTGV